MKKLIFEQTRGTRWIRIPEDPMMSRVSCHVMCAQRSRLGIEWICNPSRTDYNRLYWVESGEAKIYVNRQEYRLKEGYSYLIPSGVSFHHECNSEVVLFWSHFSLLWDHLRELFEYIDLPVELNVNKRPEIPESFKKLERLATGLDMASHLARSALIFQLIQPHLEHAHLKQSTHLEDHDRFQPILQYIEDHIKEQISVEEIAALMGLHAEYFSRYFRNKIGLPPKQYILQRRILRAQRLLYDKTLQIQEIGAECGMPDRFYFSKTFKKRVGLTPTEYRAANT